MDNAQIDMALGIALSKTRSYAPVRTGNLKDNATKRETLSGTEWRIYVDEKVAPYMPYTTEKWTSPKWNGRRNPNECWWDKAVTRTIDAFASAVGGTATRIN